MLMIHVAAVAAAVIAGGDEIFMSSAKREHRCQLVFQAPSIQKGKEFSN